VVGRIVLNTACALAVSLGAFNVAGAQSNSPQSVPPRPMSASEDHLTVLTMAPDGAWGVATDMSTNRAIAGAIANCKTMSRAELGCGAYSSTIRAGWSLGIRCGNENIIVAEKTLAGALQAAINRETELRQLYAPDMPPCTRVVTVDPHGAIVEPKPDYANRSGSRTDEGVATPQSPSEIPIWKTITLGTHKGVDAYRDALDAAAINIGDSADELLGRPAFPFGAIKRDLELVILTVAELGVGAESASLSDVYKRAMRLGLELCPAEAGPQLRLDYPAQRVGEFLHIAMEPVATWRGDLMILTLANGGNGLLLIASDGTADARALRDWLFVFALPTSTARAAQAR